MKNNASLAYNFFLVLGDLFVLFVSFVAAFAIRAAEPTAVANPMEATTYALILASLLPFWLLIFALLGLYNSNIYERRFAEAGRLFVGSFIGLLFLTFWDFITLDPIFPAKLVPVYGLAIAFVLLLITRNLARLLRTSMFAYGRGLTRIAIIGNTPISLELCTSLRNSKVSGYQIIGLVGYRKKLPYSDIPQFTNFAQFLESDPQDLHGIVQTELYPNEVRNTEVLSYAQEHHVSYRFVPGNSELFVGNIDVDLFRNNIPVIHVHHTALFGWGRIFKRLTDIVLGTIALLLTSPLWVVCIIGIKLSDRGPILYKASRYSRFGSKVGVYKFRSMKQAYSGMSPEAGFEKMGRPELIKQYRDSGDQLADDPRVTRFGKFMRATSLDELPQIWNVVHGEISLVGPRALDVFEMEKYDKKNLILSVKSGLTGLAVVSGRHAMSFEERRKLDLYYVQNWSFGLDLIILMKTIRVVVERLFRRGARYES